MLYINTDTGKYPVYEDEVRRKFYPISLPQHIPDSTLNSGGFARVVETSPTLPKKPWESYVEVAPVLDGQYYKQRWEITPLNLAEKKVRALAHFNEIFNTLISQVKVNYPSTEVESWAKQEKEAREFLSNNQAPALLIRAIASSRGLSVEDLANRVVQKADAYAQYVGNLIGTRQMLEDQIEQATEETIDSITWPPE